MEQKYENNKLEELIGAARRSTAVHRATNPPVAGGEVHSPVVELVTYILTDALRQNASEIHIEPGRTGGRLRYRIDGALTTIGPPVPTELYGSIISRLKIMCRLNIAETRLPQDGRCSYQYGDQEIDVRVSVVPLIRGEKMVLRLLNRASRFLSLDSLQLSQENQNRFVSLCREPSGAIIMAGPVNSGKTTALYGALHYLNDSGRNIVSIEDPVEYQLEGINQLQVNTRIGLDFEEALQAVLRQDYDILAIGEIRSDAVAQMLIRAALTGHLVFATIHTAEAAKVIYRLLEMGIKPYLLAVALKGIVAQRLVPRLCPDCRQVYQPDEGSDVARFLGQGYEPGMKLFHRGGCAKCRGRGVRGRLAIQEIMLISESVQRCIINRADGRMLGQAIRESGMGTMQEDGIKKARAGLVEIEEIMKVCEEGKRRGESGTGQE